MWHRFVFFVSIIAVAVCAQGSGKDAKAPLTLVFSSDTVTVSGAGRGHQVVVFGLGIGNLGRYALLTRDVETPTDTDGDGIVTVTPRQLPYRSLWIAVDMEDGRYGVASPAGALPKLLEPSSGTWRSDLRELEVSRRFLEVLLVRPRGGAWTLRTTEGGPKDADGRRNGLLRIRLDRMQRLTDDSNGPPVALPKDLLVVVDPQTLHYYIGAAE